MKSKNKLPSYLLYKRLLAEGKRLVALENENFLAVIMRFAGKISELIIHRDRKVTSKLKVFYRFGKYLVFLNKKHGSLFTVKYLKASLLSIQRAIAGSPVKSLREIEPDLPLPRLSRSGLPVGIGTRDRRAILSHSLSVVQFYLSLYSLHRVIEAPVKAKLHTITDVFNGSSTFLEKSLGYFEFEFKKLIRVPKMNLKGDRGREVGLLLLQTSSSSNKTFSGGSWAYDAWLIRKDPAQYALIRKGLELTENFELLSILNMSRIKPNAIKSACGHLGIRSDAALGRLSFKEEAAGKLRVFAMVDSGTQSIFKPLHTSLFSLLNLLPNDATFNQGAAFKRAITKAEKSGHSYGFDLSAATDRLPLIIQIKILSGIIGPHLASLGGLILTERDYILPENSYDLPVGRLRYAVGQPMGALSSGAMLALTHHALVQYANHLIGNRGWTESYEVLGDDIVIFDPSLATKYVELMSLYGVELNMSKSVISHGKQPTVEFAKRTSLKGKDCSPLSMKMFLNQDSFKGRLSTFAFGADRIESHFIPAFKTIMKSVRGDNRPGNDKFALLGLLSLSITKGVLPFEGLLREMKDKRAYFVRKGKMLLADFPTDGSFKVAKLLLEKKDISHLEPRNPHSYMFEQRGYKAAIIKRITGLIQTYDSVDPWDLKLKTLDVIGLGGPEGVFVRHLWIPKFDDGMAKSYLTLRFYKNLQLHKYSLQMLLQFLDEVEGAASILSVIKQKKRDAKVLKDGLRFLQFIDKTIVKGFRDNPANQKLALESSGTQISERRSMDPLNELVPGYGGTTPAGGLVDGRNSSTAKSVTNPSNLSEERQRVLFGGLLPAEKPATMGLGTTTGNYSIEMPPLTEERKRVLFGIRDPVPDKELVTESIMTESGLPETVPRGHYYLNLILGTLLFGALLYLGETNEPNTNSIQNLVETKRGESPGPTPKLSVIDIGNSGGGIVLAILCFGLGVVMTFVWIYGHSYEIVHINDLITYEMTCDPFLRPLLLPSIVEHGGAELSSDSRYISGVLYESIPTPAIIRSPEIAHGGSEPYDPTLLWG